MHETARMASVVSSTLPARRRLIRSVRRKYEASQNHRLRACCVLFSSFWSSRATIGESDCNGMQDSGFTRDTDCEASNGRSQPEGPNGLAGILRIYSAR